MEDQSRDISIIGKNIKVASVCSSTGDFPLMNIIGNRIMSDSLFLDNRACTLIGFFIKQIALMYLALKPRATDSDFLEARLAGEKYIESLTTLSAKIDVEQLWSDYHEFNISVMKFPSSEIDRQIKEIYGQDLEFTELVRKWLIKYLIDNKEILFDNRNNFFKGIANEFQRVGLSFGYSAKDTMIYSCLLSLDRYFDYFRMQYSVPGDLINKDAVIKIIFPYLSTINAISESANTLHKDTTDFIWNTVKGWREYFILYSEAAKQLSDKPIELSKDSKARLSEVVSKALQKELKPG